MKKLTIVLLIAVLAVSFAFADFSGDAYIQFNADIDAKEFGFANGTDYGFSFEFDSEKVNIAGEEDIHVELAASAQFYVDADLSKDQVATFVWDNQDSGLGLGVVMSISKARIAGSNWYVDILGAKSGYNYASAAVLQVRSKSQYSFGAFRRYVWQAASYSAAYSKAPGVTVGYDGYTASFGFLKNADGTAASATIESKQFKFSDDAFTVQAAAEVSKKAGAGVINAGASVKGTAAIQDINVALAADLGLEKIPTGDSEEKPVFGFDARADFAYDFVEVNVYAAAKKGAFLKYAGSAQGANYKYYSDLYLEAQAAFDLNAFELPLAVTVNAKNIVDKSDAGIDLGLSVDYAQDAISAGLWADFNLKTKAWDVNLSGAYAAEKFTAGANIYVEGGEELAALSFGAYAESDKIVNGATFGINYGLSNAYAMYYGGNYVASNAVNTNNFIGDEAAIGTIGAYCMIAF